MKEEVRGWGRQKVISDWLKIHTRRDILRQILVKHRSPFWALPYKQKNCYVAWRKAFSLAASMKEQNKLLDSYTNEKTRRRKKTPSIQLLLKILKLQDPIFLHNLLLPNNSRLFLLFSMDILLAIAECLGLRATTVQYVPMSESKREKILVSERSDKDIIDEVISIIITAEKDGPLLRSQLRDIIGTETWKETIAKGILFNLEQVI